ncbi:RHS repeat-associated core domain-containing protein [Nonomuraea solani]|uniref:RHS repeat-associated core domain-containing protein n=1 Tax=Nonomuraea solani TaxID=1144553 RepID=A0A1H5Y839_9ACTN|nr:RHS repeat-associated core domain-containing protein [Nonomuraea solani]SEG20134.1 RHS repeat-associated core domain-containing protein [Nonomuraea solani]
MRLWPITVLSCLFIMLLASTPAGATPSMILAATTAQAPVRPSKPQEVEPVPGKEFVPAEARPDPEAPPARQSAARADWPSAGAADVALPAALGNGAKGVAGIRAGSLPVSIAATGRSGPERVKIEVLDRTAAAQAGVDGLLLSLRRTDGKSERGPVAVTVDYSAFRDAYGGDWASRLRLMPHGSGDAPVTGTRNDPVKGTVSATVSIGDTGSTFALAAASAGPNGDYQATSLAPSGRWQVSTQGGGFTWAYPMDTPPVPGDLAPELALSYSSAAVDGRTVSTNNQSSWAGEGWNLSPGFIERSYKGCADDLGGNNGQTKTGDLCWETENASLSFDEQSGRMVFQNNVWRPERDDGTRIEHLFRDGQDVNGDDNGEYWKVTTTDGTQYFFGLNRLPGWTAGRETTQSTWTVPVYGNDAGEPCFQSTYAASACTQAYRWNLDHVVDAHGNSMSYFYQPETNRYAQNLAAATGTYTRGGTLARIDYGTRSGAEYSGPAPARVVLDTADRCAPGQNCAAHNTTTWPDVPWDADCSTAPCGTRYSPSFWSTKRLAKITTQVSTGGGNYRGVDQWEFAHTYPTTGDHTTPSLWLNSITRTGLAGSTAIKLPPVTFDGTMMANRVNSATDGLPKLNKPRVTTITSESGGEINVHYKTPDCAPGAVPAKPESNTKRCFPVRWTMPPATEPADDWFHKYVVEQVVEDDLATDAKDMVTNYDYDIKGGAWAYIDDPLIDPKYRTWAEWRGFEKVTVRKGDPANDENKPESKTQYLYFRGMHGDRLSPAGGTKPAEIIDSAGVKMFDIPPLAGFLREEISYTSAAEHVGRIHDPWTRLTATQGRDTAYQVEIKASQTRERRNEGTYRVTRVETAYDEYGNPTQVNDLGNTSGPSDDQCTTITYAHNVEAMLVEFPSEKTTVGVACGNAPSYPDDAISGTRMSYDGQAHGRAPLRGDVTTTENAESYTGATAVYLVGHTSTFDSHGRVMESRDALNRPTTTSYTEVNGLTVTTAVANPLRHTVTTTLDPAWGTAVQVEDANELITSLTYDALGRLTEVYKPGRTEAAGDSPHLRYDYGISRNRPNWIRTTTLRANGNSVAGYELFDGFSRPRQTQAPSPSEGRILTDTLYDSRGLVSVTRAAYHEDTTGPGTTLFQPDAGKVPAAVVTVYDGAERKTAEIFLKLNVEKWRTTTIPNVDSVTTIPPQGDTATTKWIDARGRMAALVQYHNRTLPSPSDITRYAYTKRGDLRMVTDAAGNVWRYTYDVLGRKIKSQDPDKGVSTMTYDDAGQLLSVTDARDKTVESVYDALGRVTQTHLATAPGRPLTKTVYDSLAKGALTSSTRYVGGHAYTKQITGYDEAGRPRGTSVTIPAVENRLAGTYTTTMTYAADGSPAAKTLPALGDLGQETIVYEYDDLGRPDKVTGNLTYVTDTEYNALGETAQVELGGGDKRLWRTTYYEEGTRRVTEQLTEREQVNGVMVNDLTYDYDPAGNLTRVTDRTAGAAKDTQCFATDHLRRITTAWTQGTDTCAATPSASVIGGAAPYWHAYTYDATGNRRTKTVKGAGGAADLTTTYAYPDPGDGVARPHATTAAITGSTTAAYSYDAAGNTLTRPGPSGAQSLVWDDEGLLTSIASGGTTTSYVYDGEGGQLIRRDPGAVTLFVGDGEIRLNTGTGSATGTRYYDGLGTRTSAGFTWTIADHHGTSHLAVNAINLATTTTRRMDLFGNLRGVGAEWPAGNRGFVGGTTNPGTGLTRLGAREYDPAIGRFISVDPVIDPSDPQQMNAYAYANNNPATMTDPDGLRYFDSLKDRLKNAAKARNARQQQKATKSRSVDRMRDKVKWRDKLDKTFAKVGDRIKRQLKDPRGAGPDAGRNWPSTDDWLELALRVAPHVLRGMKDWITEGLERIGSGLAWLFENRGKILGTLGFVAALLCNAGRVCHLINTGLFLVGLADNVVQCIFGGSDACVLGALSLGTFALGKFFSSAPFESKTGSVAVAGLDLALSWVPTDWLFGTEPEWSRLERQPLRQIPRGCEDTDC